MILSLDLFNCQSEALIKEFLSSLIMTKVDYQKGVRVSLSNPDSWKKPAFDRLRLTP